MWPSPYPLWSHMLDLVWRLSSAAKPHLSCPCPSPPSLPGLTQLLLRKPCNRCLSHRRYLPSAQGLGCPSFVWARCRYPCTMACWDLFFFPMVFYLRLDFSAASRGAKGRRKTQLRLLDHQPLSRAIGWGDNSSATDDLAQIVTLCWSIWAHSNWAGSRAETLT